MKLAEKIEHLEYWMAKNFLKDKPWKKVSHSRKAIKRLQHRVWRHWSKKNLDENSNKPMYNRYSGWEY